MTIVIFQSFYHELCHYVCLGSCLMRKSNMRYQINIISLNSWEGRLGSMFRARPVQQEAQKVEAPVSELTQPRRRGGVAVAGQ